MGNSQLYRAIWERDTDEVKRLLASGQCSSNGDDSFRDPPIIECVRLEHEKPARVVSSSSLSSRDDKEDIRSSEILKTLVQYGANLNVQSKSPWVHTGSSAAMVAASENLLGCLQILVESGANLSITSPNGQTALILAVMQGQASCVKYLTERMSLSMINYRDVNGNTALMHAASGLHSYGCLQHIIEAGADLDVKSENGYTALLIALKFSSTKAATLLLEKGAQVTKMNISESTTLTVDIACSYPEKFVNLLRQGLDPTLSRDNRNCLHEMVLRRSTAVVRGLVMHGFPPLDLDCRRFPFYVLKSPLSPLPPISPLSVAILLKRPHIAKYLIANCFFTHYDIVRLCWEPEISRSLKETREDATSHQARQCLDILRFLSTRPRSLYTLCLVTISSILSQDFALDLPHTPEDKTKWTCRPSFREKIELLEIPSVLKRALLHQTPSSSICCDSWDNICLEEEV
ncbi:hypothetical protein RRG08_019680 [Elysia crispata]|uniref:Uncharacterized protein n=1 Tax=Elysia crispata TaxID=231223 RepID=A0AAE1D5L8_9GAST|nr:hypothetical protein RRG08_019680 [Elysia crispata]